MSDGPQNRPATQALLMVAYHFPPLAGSSGIQRTLRFVQQLPGLGWQPLVLTVQPHAYERISADLLADVPDGTVVERAFALDTARQLSLGGRYWGAMARPDRWASWRFDGVRRGLQLVRRHAPRAIWSTFPIPSAHAIGLALARKTGLPWIADFRDPMAQDGYPADPALWRAFDRLERETIRHASWSVFTTPGAARIYRERYPAHADRIVVLENGFDEDSFRRAEAGAGPAGPLTPGVATLVHSGIVYPQERDPAPLFEALHQAKAAGLVGPGNLRVRFRSPVHEGLLNGLTARFGLEGIVEVMPAIPYLDALREMQRAEGLLLMQGANCNEQIPAKAYEYLRAGRPILCLADPAGDTASVVQQAGVDTIAPLEDAQAIARELARFVDLMRAGRAPLPSPEVVASAARTHRSEQLVQLLERLPRRDRRS